jgi:hypothetical protein
MKPLTFEEWQEYIWYGSGEGYEGLGRSFDDQCEIYKEYVEEFLHVEDNRAANATPNRNWDYVAVWKDEKDDGPDISDWAYGRTPKEAINNFIREYVE